MIVGIYIIINLKIKYLSFGNKRIISGKKILITGGGGFIGLALFS